MKRKVDEDRPISEGRKRRATQNGDSASIDIEQLGKSITKDPSKNHKGVESLIRIIDLNNPDAKTNLRTGVALCKVFARLVASGDLVKDDHGSKQGQEISQWYLQQYGTYRTVLVKLLRSVSPSHRLPILHLCWRVLEQDAELMGNSVWVSDSIFKPLLSAVLEMPDGTDIRDTYVGEYMIPCHDCCYYSLEYFSYVSSALALCSKSLIPVVKVIYPYKRE